MHELSIVMSIIGIAEKESAKNNASAIEEIELEIGELSGVETQAFDFAWEQAVRSSVLETTERKVTHIAGEGYCCECKTVFTMHRLFDPCPSCGSHLIEIKKGKELRVISLVVS